jgi:hypothetical protein
MSPPLPTPNGDSDLLAEPFQRLSLEAPAPEKADLLAGTGPFDVLALRQSAERFFSLLGDLKEEGIGWSSIGKMHTWLVAGAIAAGAAEIVRRQRWLLPEYALDRNNGWRSRSSAWFAGLGLLPPSDTEP